VRFAQLNSTKPTKEPVSLIGNRLPFWRCRGAQILDGAMLGNLVEFRLENGIIEEGQYAFVKGKGCEANLY